MTNYLQTLSCEKISSLRELIRTISMAFLKAKAEHINKQYTKMSHSMVIMTYSRIWITVNCIKHLAMVGSSTNNNSSETKTYQATTTKRLLTSDLVIRTH